MKASERLAQALHAIGEFKMEQKAREGYYGDFTSPLAMPITQLVTDLKAKGHDALAYRAMKGEFDGE
jgi:hypothetical protein